MCGIFGIATTRNVALSKALLTKIDDDLAHRGPDGFGSVCLKESNNSRKLDVTFNRLEDTNTRLWVLHRRLSIIDLSELGSQPFFDDRREVSISVNGEIYNYQNLRNELEKCGYSFRSNSDSEVVLHGYKEWGESILDRLEGMFGLAIVDSRSSKILVARDRFGIKPIYFMRLANGVAFSSEVPPLHRVAKYMNAPMSWNHQAVYDYLRHGTTGIDGQTVFGHVQHLLPAHKMTFDLVSGDVNIGRYWKPENGILDIGYEDAVSRTRELFIRAVESHLMADVPVATTLSGGIDSSSILSVISRELGRTADVFSFISQDPRHSEEKWIDHAAKGLNIRLHKLPLAEQDFESVCNTIRYQAEPFSGASIFAQNSIHKAVSANGFKVVLDGQGADEMMAGYIPHVGSHIADLLRERRFLEGMRKIKAFLSSGNPPSYLAVGMVDTLLSPRVAERIRRLRGASAWPAYLDRNASVFDEVHTLAERGMARGDRKSTRALLNRSLYHDSIPQLLRYADRNAMMYSIENRVPFLDNNLSSFLVSLPVDYSVSGNCETKAVFRDAMRGIVNEPILTRRDKVGFFESDTNLLRDIIRPVIADIESAKNHEISQYLNWNSVQNITKNWESNATAVWRIFNLVKSAEIANY